MSLLAYYKKKILNFVPQTTFFGLKLNGSTNYMSFSNSNIYSAGTAVEKYMVIQFILRTSSTPSTTQGIMSDFQSATANFSVNAGIDSAGLLFIRSDASTGGSSSSDTISTTTAITDGDLHRITYLLDARSGFTQRFRVYIDGVLDTEDDNISSLDGIAKELTQPMVFGRLGNLNARYFNGDLFEVSIFNTDTAMSLADLESYANGYTNVATPSHKWVFDDLTGTYNDKIGSITNTWVGTLPAALTEVTI
jgi:hypothetical protein